MQHFVTRRVFGVQAASLLLVSGLSACGSITALPADGGAADDAGAGSDVVAAVDTAGGDAGGDVAAGDAAPADRAPAGDAPANDASRDVAGDIPGDVRADAPPPACDPSKPFGAPVAVPGLPVDTRAGIVARLSPDELTVYFSRVDQARVCCDYQIQVATRASRAQPFGAATLLDAVNTTAIDQSPSITADGLTLYFASDRNMALGVYKLYVATRALATDTFTLPVPVVLGSSAPSIDSSPYVLPAGDVLYFGSARSGGGDLYRAERSNGAFGDPSLVPVSSPLLEVTPVVTPDERTIYFASDRVGGALGGFDVWTATRTDRSAAFGPVANVQAVNSADDERPTFVSADGCRLYIARAVGASQYSVLMAERPR